MVAKEKTNNNVHVNGRITADMDMDTFGIIFDIDGALWAIAKLKAIELKLKYDDAITSELEWSEQIAYINKIAHLKLKD